MKSWLLGRGYLLLSIIAFTSLGRLQAQNFTVLHSFSTATNSPVRYSPNRLVLSGNTIYGVYAAGSNNTAFVFAINTDGTGYTYVHTFAVGDGGTFPNSLIVSDKTIYGSTSGGGFGSGTLFAMQTDGSGFTNLYRFSAVNGTTNDDGAFPLVSSLAGNVLYGVASAGGTGGSGTVFAINTDGSRFTLLYSFSVLNGDYFNTDGRQDGPTEYENSDGAQPADMVLSGDSLYGTTSAGGPADILGPNYSSGVGNVFDIKTNTTGFTVLHSFPPDAGPLCYNPVGKNPNMRPVVSGNVVYGVTPLGYYNLGTLFAVNVDGSDFRVLHIFGQAIYPPPNSGCPPPALAITNDGAMPEGPLTLVGNTLYGTTSAGGAANLGTIFQINTDGTSFTLLHSFADDTNGFNPQGPLIVTGNMMYGITSVGGTGGGGTVFKMSFVPEPPQLTITTSATNLVLTWPTNLTGYAVHSTTNLNSPNWTTNLSAPVVVNGLFTVTNSVSGTQQFFRLTQ